MLRKAAIGLLIFAACSTVLLAGEKPNFITGSVLLGWLETTVPPEVTCIGGERTPGGYLPCSEGTQRIRGRGEEQIWGPESPSEEVAALLDGPITFMIDCNFSDTYRGPCWGTFRWEVPDVGTWEGHWTAPVMDLLTYESQISMVGYGEGGTIDGMHLKLDGYSNPGDWFISCAVRIKP